MEANKAATPTGAKHTATPWHRNIKPAAKYPVIFAGQNTHVAQVVAWGLPDEVVEANLEFIIRACNAHDDLVKAAQDAYQQPWNPDSFGGYSEEQLALIRVGFNHAMNGVYAAVKPALAKVGA